MNGDVAQSHFTKLSEALYLNFNREAQNYADLLRLFFVSKDLLFFNFLFFLYCLLDFVLLF